MVSRGGITIARRGIGAGGSRRGAGGDNATEWNGGASGAVWTGVTRQATVLEHRSGCGVCWLWGVPQRPSTAGEADDAAC